MYEAHFQTFEIFGIICIHLTFSFAFFYNTWEISKDLKRFEYFLLCTRQNRITIYGSQIKKNTLRHGTKVCGLRVVGRYYWVGNSILTGCSKRKFRSKWPKRCHKVNRLILSYYVLLRFFSFTAELLLLLVCVCICLCGKTRNGMRILTEELFCETFVDVLEKYS